MYAKQTVQNMRDKMGKELVVLKMDFGVSDESWGVKIW
jgi:hypothetical protein